MLEISRVTALISIGLYHGMQRKSWPRTSSFKTCLGLLYAVLHQQIKCLGKHFEEIQVTEVLHGRDEFFLG